MPQRFGPALGYSSSQSIAAPNNHQNIKVATGVGGGGVHVGGNSTTKASSYYSKQDTVN